MKILLLTLSLIACAAAAAQLPDKTLCTPEIAGTLRFGLQHETDNFWLSSCNVKQKNIGQKQCFEIKDRRFAKGKISIEIQPLLDTHGYTVKILANGLLANSELYWAYGASLGEAAAVDNKKNNLLPAYCADNVFSVEGSAFTVYYGTSRNLKIISAISPTNSKVRLSDAHVQTSPKAMFNSGKKTDAPALCAHCALHNDEPLYFVVYKQNPKADYNYYMLPQLHEKGSYIIHTATDWMESTPN
jgi:hypothetical protein